MLEEKSNYTLEEMDRQSLFHPLTSITTHMRNGPLIVERGRGVRIQDHKGRELIDCGAGLWCVNIGYGRPEIAEAAKRAIENLNYYHIFGSASSEPIIRLADRILTLFRDQAAPATSPGSSSAARLGRQRHERQAGPLLQQPARASSEEEDHRASRRLSRSDLRCRQPHRHSRLPPGLGPAARSFLHTSCPHWYRFAEPGESENAFCDRMIADLEALIEREGADTIAAFFAEPIMGTGGVLLPPAATSSGSRKCSSATTSCSSSTR